jgi:hypothetical protein
MMQGVARGLAQVRGNCNPAVPSGKRLARDRKSKALIATDTPSVLSRRSALARPMPPRPSQVGC